MRQRKFETSVTKIGAGKRAGSSDGNPFVLQIERYAGIVTSRPPGRPSPQTDRRRRRCLTEAVVSFCGLLSDGLMLITGRHRAGFG